MPRHLVRANDDAGFATVEAIAEEAQIAVSGSGSPDMKKLTKTQMAFLQRITARTDIDYTSIRNAGESRMAKNLERLGLVSISNGLFASITDDGRKAVAASANQSTGEPSGQASNAPA